MAVVVDTVTPDAGTGLGPHVLTLTGSGFPTTPNSCQVVMKDAGGTTVAQSGLVTAADATSVTASLRFELFTPTGVYTSLLVAGGIGTEGPSFTLTRIPPTVPGPDGLAGYGQWYRDARFPANRPR